LIVHAGFALNKIDEFAALESLKILKEADSFAEKHSEDNIEPS
jgi:hydrogenase maturation factor